MCKKLHSDMNITYFRASKLSIQILVWNQNFAVRFSCWIFFWQHSPGGYDAHFFKVNFYSFSSSVIFLDIYRMHGFWTFTADGCLLPYFISQILEQCGITGSTYWRFLYEICFRRWNEGHLLIMNSWYIMHTNLCSFFLI